MWGSRWHPRLPPPGLATQMASPKSSCRKTPDRTRSCACQSHGKRAGVLWLAGSRLRASPPKSRGMGSPRKKEVLLPEEAESRCWTGKTTDVHCTYGWKKAVSRALYMGQTITEDDLLIHTENKHFPTPADYTNSVWSWKVLFLKIKKQLLSFDLGEVGSFIYI